MRLYRSAKTLCDLSNWSLSNLQLQKLLYLAHMVSLGEKGVPLNDGQPFQAWDLGPVQPDVYQRVKAYGSSSIPNIFPMQTYESSDWEYEVLKDIYDQLGDKPASKLVAITHWDDGAWAKNYERGVRGITIPDVDILDEYKLRFDAAS